MKITFFLFLLLIILTSYGPPNCNLYIEDEQCQKACNECEHGIMHQQGSAESQRHFDESIKLCPTFDYAFYEKAVPYAKRGLIKKWKLLIDKALELNPEEYLGTRGWYHFFFMHNYEESIKDIDRLDSLIDYDIGDTGDGLYHLNIMKGLCYKGLNKKEKAIKIISNQIKKPEHSLGAHDLLHLGVLYIETKEYDSAYHYLSQQLVLNENSETHYYLSKIFDKKEEYKKLKHHINKAKKLYEEGRSMRNSYIQLFDEIYLEDVKKDIFLYEKKYN